MNETTLRFLIMPNGRRKLQQWICNGGGIDDCGVQHFAGQWHWADVPELEFFSQDMTVFEEQKEPRIPIG